MEIYGNVNMTEVARRAGVSLSTVSRVIRNKDDVSRKTQAKVMAVMEETGYRPNLLVSGIRTGKTLTVGVLLSWDLTFDGQIIRGIHDELQAANHVPVLQLLEPSGPPEIELLHRLLDHRVDGVITRLVDEEGLDMYVNELVDRKIPVVAVDVTLENLGVDFVGNNDELGGRLAAEHLIKFGHRRLGALVFPTNFSTSRVRLKAFENAVREGLGVTVSSVTDPSFGVEDSAAMELLNRRPRPTGIFVNNDRLALGIYSAAEKIGLRLPEDLSVVGFGDFSLCGLIRPKLTTIRQHPYEIGCKAATIILERLLNDEDKSSEPRQILLDVDLVERDSVTNPKA